MHEPDANHTSPEDAITTAPHHETIHIELLDLCEKFFRTASDSVHTELRQFLSSQGYHPIASHGWFLDGLALTTYAPRDLQ